MEKMVAGRGNLGKQLATCLIAAVFGLNVAQTSFSLAYAAPVNESQASERDIPAYIKNAVESPDRPEADRRLDAERKPAQMLMFLGIKPKMKVADLYAGAGYTTELIARVVGPEGKVYSINGPFPPKFKRFERVWKDRVKRPPLQNNVVLVEKPFNSESLFPVKPGSLDAVIINLNYHDLVNRGVNREKLNKAIYEVLKPGGVYGIVDNSARNGSGIKDTKTLHRIDEAYVIDEVTKAGFKLAASSDIYRNPKDDRTWFIFKHRGQQDRFMLKFVKPEK